MNFEEIIGKVGIYLASFLVSMAGGFIPIINVETFLVLVSSTSPKSVVLPVVLLSTSAQMMVKSLMYFAGKGVLNLKFKKGKDKLEKIKKKLEKWKHSTNLFLFISASTGFPTFYVVSILAGSLKIKFRAFFILGFLGIFLKFLVVSLVPQFVKHFMN